MSNNSPKAVTHDVRPHDFTSLRRAGTARRTACIRHHIANTRASGKCPPYAAWSMCASDWLPYDSQSWGRK